MSQSPPPIKARPASRWSASELDALHIVVEDQPEQTFFNHPTPLPDFAVPPELLLTTCSCQATDVGVYQFLRLMEVAEEERDSASVLDFTVAALHALKVVPDGMRVARTGHRLPLTIHGEATSSRTDVSVVDKDDMVVLVVREDPSGANPEHGQFDPEPQVIADAIAAFGNNNHRRVNKLKLPALRAGTVAALTMDGTVPTFYKVAVTEALVEAVRTGTRLDERIVVARCVIQLKEEGGLCWSLDNRRDILACLEAFKQFVK